MNEISKLIRQISVYNSPDISYFNSFLPRYKMYRKAKIRRQKIMVVTTLIAILFMGILSFSIIDKINQTALDIQTASGVENESK